MGRRVVAVDASASLIAAGRERFAAELSTVSSPLCMVPSWVSQKAQAAELLFHPHPERSEWGSVDLRWVRRNAEAHGLPHAPPVQVPALCLEDLWLVLAVPLLKIDIEGADEAGWQTWPAWSRGLPP